MHSRSGIPAALSRALCKIAHGKYFVLRSPIKAGYAHPCKSPNAITTPHREVLFPYHFRPMHSPAMSATGRNVTVINVVSRSHARP